MAQARALVKTGELPAIQVGGRNQWRVERTVLEEYIAQRYRENQERLKDPDRDPADSQTRQS